MRYETGIVTEVVSLFNAAATTIQVPATERWEVKPYGLAQVSKNNTFVANRTIDIEGGRGYSGGPYGLDASIVPYPVNDTIDAAPSDYVRYQFNVVIIKYRNIT